MGTSVIRDFRCSLSVFIAFWLARTQCSVCTFQTIYLTVTNYLVKYMAQRTEEDSKEFDSGRHVPNSSQSLQLSLSAPKKIQLSFQLFLGTLIHTVSNVIYLMSEVWQGLKAEGDLQRAWKSQNICFNLGREECLVLWTIGFESQLLPQH